MRESAVVACVFAFLISSSSADAAPNLLTNGNFEQGNVGFETEYDGSRWEVANGYVLTTNPHSVYGALPSYNDHTSGSGLMMLVNGSDMPNAVWRQTVSITPGTSYVFGGWVANSSGYDSWYNSCIQVTINGTVICEYWTTYDPTKLPYHAGDGIWRSFGGEWTSGSSTTATITIREVSGRGTWAGNDFTLDDLSFATVPEPGTMVGAAGASLLLMRRKRIA